MNKRSVGWKENIFDDIKIVGCAYKLRVGGVSGNTAPYFRPCDTLVSHYGTRYHNDKIKALRVLVETMSCDFSSCRLSRVHFCR